MRLASYIDRQTDVGGVWGCSMAARYLRVGIAIISPTQASMNYL